MGERVAQHAHCEICGKVVTVGKRVCSQECQEKLDEATKAKKRSAVILVALIFLAVILTKIPSPF